MPDVAQLRRAKADLEPKCFYTMDMERKKGAFHCQALSVLPHSNDFTSCEMIKIEE